MSQLYTQATYKSDKDTLKKEIFDSKNRLKDMLKTGIYACAYPHAGQISRQKSYVSKNYRIAFRINPALIMTNLTGIT